MTERFTLLSELGRGGMGVVWKARDEETGQIVALKLLHAAFAVDADYVTRFERELELAKRIHSAHVVEVLGYGARDGTPYLALEYVDGPSLRELLASHGPYAWPEAKPLLVQIAQGLADAHAAGVVHRDLKPSNVLVGADGVARLADFGIAKGLDLTRVTGTSTLLGTPAYLAPEGPLDERSDLYSLGIVAYELLTGTAPFAGATYQEVIVRHIREAPDLAKLPKEARQIVGRLLAKNPAKRPQRAVEVLLVLERDRRAPAPDPTPPPAEPQPETVAPRPMPALPAPLTRSRRHCPVISAIGIALTVLIAVVGVVEMGRLLPPASDSSQTADLRSTSGKVAAASSSASTTTRPALESPSLPAGSLSSIASGSPVRSRTDAPSGIPTPTPNARGTSEPNPIATAGPPVAPTQAPTAAARPSAVTRATWTDSSSSKKDFTVTVDYQYGGEAGASAFVKVSVGAVSCIRNGIRRPIAVAVSVGSGTVRLSLALDMSLSDSGVSISSYTACVADAGGTCLASKTVGLVRAWLVNADFGCGLQPVAGLYRVIITPSGFEPQTVNVAAGDAVQWINESGGDASVNSDPYPTN